MNNSWNFNTNAIHCHGETTLKNRTISQPIVPAVAYRFNTIDDAVHAVNNNDNQEVYYGRYGNPTSRDLEKKVALLENAEDCLAVSSGMAAISIALMNFLNSGDHVIVTKDVYGGTHKFLTTIAEKYNINYEFVDCTNTGDVRKKIKTTTKAIFIETPSNPSLKIINIKKISKISEEFNIPLIIDNTFMTPYLQKPLELGADVVIHSATKYLNGHGDVIAGLICTKQKYIQNMRKNIMGDLGQNLNAWEAFLILRGIKTLGIRMKQHCNSAQFIAEFLSEHPKVESVNYLGLTSHPQNHLAKTQMKMMGGVISFELKGGDKYIKDFINNLKIIIISFSLGDPETLIQHPASMTHSSIPEEDLKDFGISK